VLWITSRLHDLTTFGYSTRVQRRGVLEGLFSANTQVYAVFWIPKCEGFYELQYTSYFVKSQIVKSWSRDAVVSKRQFYHISMTGIFLFSW